MKIDERKIFEKKNNKFFEIWKFNKNLKKKNRFWKNFASNFAWFFFSNNYTLLQIAKKFVKFDFVFEIIRNDFYELFNFYFNIIIIELLIKHINRNAIFRRKMKIQKLHKHQIQRFWKNVNDEQKMCVFIDVLFIMNFCNCKRYETYWNFYNDQFVIQIVKNVMSLNRFENIKRYLKINNSNNNIDDKNFE